MLGYKKGNKKLLTGQIPLHYPGDRVYLDGDTTKTVQDKCARKADLTNLDLTGTTNTTGSTISSGTYFYLNGTLVRAKQAIQNGADFTLGTNYEVVTVGGLNELNQEKAKKMWTYMGYVDLGLTELTLPSDTNEVLLILNDNTLHKSRSSEILPITFLNNNNGIEISAYIDTRNYAQFSYNSSTYKLTLTTATFGTYTDNVLIYAR